MSNSSKMTALSPANRAAFATTARLISCLVTESLTRALYFPIRGFEATGFAVILSGNVSSRPPSEQPYGLNDVLAIIPLLHVPVFKHDGTDFRGREIGLIDPLDMLPLVFELDGHAGKVDDQVHLDLSAALLSVLSGPGWTLPVSAKLTVSEGPLALWEKLAISMEIQPSLREEIAEELSSSVTWQTYSYEHPPVAPLFTSPSIEWEQSIVEGHPTHPMHKTRHFLPPIREITPGSYDLYHPRVRLVAVPKEKLSVTYDFEKDTRPILEAASTNAGEQLVVPEGFVVVPVHELQVAHVREKFQDVQVYPSKFSVPASAQQSIRSMILPGTYHDRSLKLGVGIKLTSAIRTISPASAYLGPRFSAQVVPVLKMDKNILTVAKELSSAVYNHPDSEIAKHCAAIVRESHENTSEERGERLIVCTSLVESGHSGVDGNIPAIIRVFKLDTEEKRVAWLDRFVRLFFEAFLPSVLENGVAFECHPQNTVARFDLKTQELLGFVIRDFGGLRVHIDTLKATTGVELDFLEGHSIIANDLDDVYTRIYHSAVHNHLQQLIRVLGLHYNGRGWEIVRSHLHQLIPKDHPLYTAWLSPDRKTLPGKCFVRMRIQGMYRFHLHAPFPNLIHYQGVQAE